MLRHKYQFDNFDIMQYLSVGTWIQLNLAFKKSPN